MAISADGEWRRGNVRSSAGVKPSAGRSPGHLAPAPPRTCRGCPRPCSGALLPAWLCGSTAQRSFRSGSSNAVRARTSPGAGALFSGGGERCGWGVCEREGGRLWSGVDVGELGLQEGEVAGDSATSPQRRLGRVGVCRRPNSGRATPCLAMRLDGATFIPEPLEQRRPCTHLTWRRCAVLRWRRALWSGCGRARGWPVAGWRRCRRAGPAGGRGSAPHRRGGRGGAGCG